jgi:multiple sugar transport system permease protein
MANVAQRVPKSSVLGSGRARRLLGGLVLHALLIVGSILMAMPFLWMVLSSFKNYAQLYQVPPSWIPNPITFDAYTKVWDAIPLASGYFNSLLITITILIVNLLTCSMAAYAFARINFPLREPLFILFLATLMIPFQSTIIPIYLIMREIGLIDNVLSVILPNALFNAFGIFLLRQFIRGLPIELEEAAIVDGANRWTVYWRIVLPLIRPALAAFGIFTFLWNWNDLFRPLIFLSSPENFTLPLVLNLLRGQYATDFSLVMAGAVIAVVPILIVFFIGQRQIIEGVAMTGLKQ